MRQKKFSTQQLRTFLRRAKIATLEQLKAALSTQGTMTIFRKLKAAGYLSSYSHRGKYYTLSEVPRFDPSGLWSHHSIWFSKHGNLVATVKAFVEAAPCGFTASELEMVLHVECKRALLKLCRESCLIRENISGVYVYFSRRASQRRKQRRRRVERSAESERVAPPVAVLSHELKAAIVLFFSLLDEKRRRLYAGLEAQKLGHGGDAKIAELLGLSPQTVVRGRRELFSGEVAGERVRKKGGGRKPVEKKLRRSSSKSTD